MATIPRASTVVRDTAGVPAGGLDVVCILAPVATSPDVTPRFYGSAQAIFDQHGYSEGLEYAALHFSRTRKAVLFVGMPIITDGVLSRRNNDGHTGTSAVSVSGTPLAEHDGVVVVEKGGVVGSSQILLSLSLDGGRVYQKLRVGTGNSIAIPYMGITLALGAGTLNEGDTVLTWHASYPRTDSASLQLARAALAGQQKAFRSMLLIGDLPTRNDAQAYLDVLNAYETENERFVFGRASIEDRLPLPQSSSVRKIAAGATLTFSSSARTITRSAGSFLTDGIAVGDAVYGSTPLNPGYLGIATGVTGTVITFAAGLVNEGPLTGTITSRTALVFAASGNTITRNAGSWLAEDFGVGQSVTISGTTANNRTATLTGVTATVLTFSAGVVNESTGMGVGKVVQALTKAAWMSAQDLEFASIDNAPRIDLSAGRGRVLSPFSQWSFRRPAAWFASLREYVHDLHVAVWRKSDGPVGADLYDDEGNLAEWDDRLDGGAASAARFTSMRSWANGPNGAYMTLSLTRGADGSLLSLTNKVAVINLVQTIAQLNTESAAIGVDLILDDDGTATTDSLSTIESQVNAALELGVLTNALGEGPRASKAVWTADPAVVFNVPEPKMLGTVDLNLNGTVHSVLTVVRVRTAGQ